MTGRPLRIAVCGTAHWAEAVHLPALQSAPGVELVAVQGRNVARREELAEKFGIAAVADFADLLDRVDAVSFAMPPDVQPGMAVAAIRAGKHIILEKPAARTVEDAARIRRAIADDGVGATCFLTRRFIPEIGAFMAEAQAKSPSTGYARFLSGALQAGSPYANSIWRKDPDATLWDVGPHALTPLLEVLGPVAEVAATRAGNTFNLRLVHAEGGRSVVTLGPNPSGNQLSEEYGFDGDDGRIDVSGPAYDRVSAFKRVVAELLDGVEAGRPTASLDLALSMVGILCGAMQAIESGKTVAMVPA